MGWFDEQIKNRKLSDQEIFEDSFVKVASVVLGKHAAGKFSKRRISKKAIDDILGFYHCKPVEIPDEITEIDEQLEYALRPHAIMHRNVILEEKWYKDAFGPMLAFEKETGTAIALIPKALSGYWFYDSKTGRKTSVNARTAQMFEKEALCFYKPLPLKKLSLKDLLIYIKGCIAPGDVALIVLATLVSVLIGLVGPKLSQALTGPVLDSRNATLLVGIAVFMVSTLVAKQLIDVINGLILARITTKTSVAVEAAVMMRIMSMPAPFFRQFSSGNLSRRASAISSLCQLLISTILSTGLTSLMSLVYITQIANFAPALLVPSVAIILLTVTLTVITSVMQVRIYRKFMEAQAKESGLNYAFISGVQKIKLSGSEKRAFAKWADVYAEEAGYKYNPPLLLKISPVLTTAIPLLGTVLLYFLAGKNNMTVSSYFAFNVSFGLVMGAFSSLSTIAVNIACIKPILEMAMPILNEEPETTEDRAVITRLSGDIELNHVSFRYAENMPYVINDLSLKIKPGEYIAIVGKTGCGKSTLMRLLLGFEKPEKGAIFYDGRELNKIDLKSIRRKVGAVMQNGGLISASLYDNITVSAPGLSLDEAWEAAELAGIAEDIKRMPMGMQTLVAEGQGGFSGGQKQRLMIARALAPKPKILMFDEATSALDNKTQKQVSDALDNLKCTRIVIAHRLSTIRNCDRIIVLEGGKIIEDGTYKQLVAKKGFFASLVERQRLDS